MGIIWNYGLFLIMGSAAFISAKVSTRPFFCRPQELAGADSTDLVHPGG